MRAFPKPEVPQKKYFYKDSERRVLVLWPNNTGRTYKLETYHQGNWLWNLALAQYKEYRGIELEEARRLLGDNFIDSLPAECPTDNLAGRF